MSTFIIIDAPAVLHRAWHALPKLTDHKDRVINACYGFTLLLLKLLREQKPDYVAVTFDTPAPTFRHKAYKEYKATRAPQPQEFYDQIPITKEVLHAFGIKVFEKEGFEADDLIGTLNNLKSKILNLKSLIVTGDLDLFQLVDDKTKIYFLKQGIAHVKIYDKDAIYARFEIRPEKLIDFKALRGDPSDNIPGAPGIGAKTASELIKKFGGVQEIYEHLETHFGGKTCLIKKSLAETLLANKKMVLLGKKLIAIKQDVKGIEGLEKCKIKEFNQEKIKSQFEKLGFKTLIKRLEKTGSQQQTLF